MVTIYDDYGDEPEDRFIPLPDHLGCEFYDLEMDDYLEDILFFEKFLPASGAILELGCGSGRFSRGISSQSRLITGVDISLTMLQRANSQPVKGVHYSCMDMTSLAFNCDFHSIIIAYNSLNLLINQENIFRCLHSCRQYLKKSGTLLAQIFIPTLELTSERKKTFQFQIFDLQPKGRLIKEILKEYSPETRTITVEERYRLRPENPDKPNTDYISSYSVAAYPAQEWLGFFQTCGFEIFSAFEDLQGTIVGSTDSSSLIVICN